MPTMVIYTAVNGWAVEYSPTDETSPGGPGTEKLVFTDYSTLADYINSVLEPPTPTPTDNPYPY